MNPEAIARLRHGLRTPLNHLIGYAEMVRDEARDQTAKDEAGLMDQVLTAARQMVELVQQWLPVKSHIAQEAIPSLRAGLKPRLDHVEKLLTSFEELTGDTCAQELRKMRSAVSELQVFTRGAEPQRPGPAPPPPQPPRPTREPLQTPPASPRGRILVVDDDGDNREILARRLEREGYTAVTEADGTAALRRLDRETFDLVLLDIFMP